MAQRHRRPRLQRGHGLLCVVARAVISDNDFKPEVVLGEAGFDHGGERIRPVVSGNDDGNKDG
jgi:hypothetical protein